VQNGLNKNTLHSYIDVGVPDANQDPCANQNPDANQAGAYSIDRFAELLSLSPWTIRKWIKNQKIESCKLGSRRVIPRSELTRLINESLTPRVDRRDTEAQEGGVADSTLEREAVASAIPANDHAKPAPIVTEMDFLLKENRDR
jgi:excisionase family DNA binding protein